MRHAFFGVLVVLCACIGDARAQPAPPGAIVEAYVAAFNGGEATMRAFFEANATPTTPVETRLQRYQQLKGDFGTLSVRRVLSSTPQLVSVEIAGSQGATGVFAFTLVPGTPP